MFGRRNKKLTRKEKLQLKAAYAAGQVRPRVSKAATTAAHKVGPQVSKAADKALEKVGPRVEQARDYAAPRVTALAATAAVAVGPHLDKALRRSGAALDALRGAEPARVVVKRRRWPVALGSLLMGLVAGAAARAFAKPPIAAPVVTRHAPPVVPETADVVVLDDAHTSDEASAHDRNL